MGEAIGGVSGSPPLSSGHGPVEAVPSIGRYLARQRKLRGMDLDEVVALTRIPRRSLERLESGAFDGVTDGFVRGFVRTVASAIGLDPDEAVARMLVEPEPGPRHRWPRVGALVGIFVVAGALAIVAWLMVGRPATPEPAALAPRPAEPATRLRRDPVRALAEAQRRSPAPPPRPDSLLDPDDASEGFSPPSP